MLAWILAVVVTAIILCRPIWIWKKKLVLYTIIIVKAFNLSLLHKITISALCPSWHFNKFDCVSSSNTDTNCLGRRHNDRQLNLKKANHLNLVQPLLSKYGHNHGHGYYYIYLYNEFLRPASLGCFTIWTLYWHFLPHICVFTACSILKIWNGETINIFRPIFLHIIHNSFLRSSTFLFVQTLRCI